MTLEKTTSSQLVPSRMNSGAIGVSVLVAASLALGGCSLLPTGPGAPVPSPESTTAVPAEATPALADKPAEQLTAAQELGAKLQTSLTTLASATKTPNREQMMSAMLEAGAVKEKVELSIDITPTGLAVDAVEAGALVAEECVVGQVRDGKVAVTLLPVLASGRCFVGDIH